MKRWNHRFYLFSMLSLTGIVTIVLNVNNTPPAFFSNPLLALVFNLNSMFTPVEIIMAIVSYQKSVNEVFSP
jgi:hypothetical protein